MSIVKITIVCLGKYKESAYIQLEKEYIKRLHLYSTIKVIEIPEEPYYKNTDLELIKLKEAEKIKKYLNKGSIVILLSENGTERSSVEFSKNLERLSSLGQELIFVIGSGIGLHDSLKEFSNYTISLSKLTFPHNIARILLLEQIYRAFTIISGKEYHKE